MRVLATLIGLGLAACTPDIVPGTYFCGPNAACPDGQVCSGSNYSCEFALDAVPFACAAAANVGPATAQALPALACVSPFQTTAACLGSGVAQAWYRFATPPMCTAVAVNVTLSFPIAFEPLDVVLADGSGAPIAADGPCKAPPADGDDSRCVSMTLADGSDYTLEVMPEAGADCAGACAYNNFSLNVELGSPN